MANNNDKQQRLNKALADLNAGGSVYLSKTSLVRKIDGKLIVFNPQITSFGELQAGNASLTKKKLAAAIAAGKASVISTAQLSAGLNPTPSVPKPPASARPKPKLKGSADDDKGKKPTPVSKVKVRKEADPELSPGKRLKNPLGALSSYNYQLSLYMITPDALEVFKENGFKDINKLGVLYSNKIGPNVANDAVTAGAYVIAQSGGVNAKETRAPSFAFDYGIDNLTYEIVGQKESGTAAANYSFKFTIIEPYGFSFISNLKRASDAIQDYNKRLVKKRADKAKKKAAAQNQRTAKKQGPNAGARQNQNTQTPADTNSGKGSSTETPQNASKQLFVLGIRFHGYNASGKAVRGTDTTAAVNLMSNVMYRDGDIIEQQIDPGNNSYALFERYFPIMITEMKTSVDGRETRYDITAAPHAQAAMGSKRGMVNVGFEITASTVGEALDKLVTNLNKEQKAMNDKTGSGYSYDIKYASRYDANRIRNATIVSKADLDKYKWPGSGAKKTKETNANTETKKGQKPKNNARTISIDKGPIIQAINKIVAQSSFLQDAMKTVYTTAIEPDQDKTGLPELDNSGRKTIEWFHLTPDIGNMSWDENKADWVYDINYVLNVYDTPVIDTAYANPGKKYYGPMKRYEYWYSGTNTEVLRYKQTLDNNYYSTFLDGSLGKGKDDKAANKNGGKNAPNASEGTGNSAGTNTPLVQNQKTGQPTQGKAGLAMEAQNSYLTSLFDASAQATAEIEILGDPDWLMSTTSSVTNDKGETVASLAQNESLVYNKFYGSDGVSINPGGGQVFFEIDFKEAIDYKSGGQNIATKDGGGVTGAPGTMSINSSILFWKDPKSISKLVKGLSYSLTRCKNTFSGGVFKQTLYATMNTFGDSASNDDGKAREEPSQRTGSGPNKGNSNATTSNTGLKAAAQQSRPAKNKTEWITGRSQQSSPALPGTREYITGQRTAKPAVAKVKGGSNSGASSNSGAKREAVVDPQTGQTLGTVTRTNNGFET